MRFAASKVPPEDEPLTRIQARRIDISADASPRPRTDTRGNGELVLIDVNQIEFIFLGVVAVARVDAPWVPLLSYAPRTLYIRTTTGLYQPPRIWTRLRALHARLDPTKFLRVNKGLLVNFDRIRVVDFETNLWRVGFWDHARTANKIEIEHVNVSRRGAQEIRRRLK